MKTKKIEANDIVAFDLRTIEEICMKALRYGWSATRIQEEVDKRTELITR